jgi:hypothetical protein
MQRSNFTVPDSGYIICDEAWAKTIPAAITIFVVGCAIPPFYIVESSFFINTIETLNMGYLHHLPKDNDFFAHIYSLYSMTGLDKSMRCRGKSVGIFFSQWDLMDTME